MLRYEKLYFYSILCVVQNYFLLFIFDCFQIEWLNKYHTTVREKVTPLLGHNSNIVDWLIKQTQPITRKNKCDPNNSPDNEIPSPSPAA